MQRPKSTEALPGAGLPQVSAPVTQPLLRGSGGGDSKLVSPRFIAGNRGRDRLGSLSKRTRGLGERATLPGAKRPQEVMLGRDSGLGQGQPSPARPHWKAEKMNPKEHSEGLPDDRTWAAPSLLSFLYPSSWQCACVRVCEHRHEGTDMVCVGARPGEPQVWLQDDGEPLLRMALRVQELRPLSVASAVPLRPRHTPSASVCQHSPARLQRLINSSAQQAGREGHCLPISAPLASNRVTRSTTKKRKVWNVQVSVCGSVYATQIHGSQLGSRQRGEQPEADFF